MTSTAREPRKNPKHKKLSFKKEIIFLCSCCAAIVVFSLAGFNTDFYLNGPAVLGARTQKTDLQTQKLFWENFLKLHPTYQPGWLALVKIEVSLGNYVSAKESFNRAKEIDPNAEEIKILEKTLKLTP